MKEFSVEKELSFAAFFSESVDKVSMGTNSKLLSFIERNALSPGNLKFNFGLTVEDSALRINEGIIFDGGNIIDNERKALLTEGFLWSPKFHEYHFRKNSDTLAADVTINILRKIVLQREQADVKYTNAVFIGGGIFPNFSHWLMEFMPRTLMLERLLQEKQINCILVSDNIPERFLFFMKKKFGPDCNIQRYPSNKVVAFENLWVIKSPVYRDSRNYMHFNLRAISDTKKIIQNSIISPKEKTNILFLGRVNETHRNVANQEELISSIKTTYPDMVEENEMHSKPMSEQINLIASASMIIEAAGGSTVLTNNIISSNTPYLLLVTPDITHDAGRKYMTLHGITPGWLFGKVAEANQDHFLRHKDLYFEAEKVLKATQFMQSTNFHIQPPLYSYV